MSITITAAALYPWCKIPYDQLENNPARKVPFRLVKDSQEMGMLMARELADEIKANNAKGRNNPRYHSMWSSVLVQTFHRFESTGNRSV